ncbi:response regulator [Microscilla marina]|uniref:Response regulator receiver domain, putative n=1 Tax=Microscilla marina ATCC 23134 TaxID=313606 RepID=A1ZV01_MICM2|nr:response regulator [Microscilla marina]EAY25779.1 response regulator receiver domain, putative [Microscilla marina ATCC 23134]
MAKIKNHYQNILLIDDDRIFIVTYHKIFSSIIKYANIEFSMSMATAIDKLHEMHKKGSFPELITLDWRLKLGGGEYFLEKFEQLYSAQYPQTKVLIISEMAQETEVSKALNYPFVTATLPKPLAMRDLSAVL